MRGGLKGCALRYCLGEGGMSWVYRILWYYACMNEDQRNEKIFPEWLRKTFLFPSIQQHSCRGKVVQGSETRNSKTWTDSLNCVWEASKIWDLVAYHSNLISPLDFNRPPSLPIPLPNAGHHFRREVCCANILVEKHKDFENFRRAFLYLLNLVFNRPGRSITRELMFCASFFSHKNMQRGNLKVYSHFSLTFGYL